jgi:hypothetical protein
VPPVPPVPPVPADLADPAATSYDLPRVPDAAETAELPAAQLPGTGFPATGFPATEFAAPVPAELVPPPAAVPPGAAQTRYDMTAVPAADASAGLDDLMAAGYDLAAAGAPAAADSGTQIIPAVGFGQAPGQATAAWPAPGHQASRGDPGMPGGPGQPGNVPAGAVRKQRRGLVAAAAAVILIAAGALGVTLTSGNGSRATPASASGVPSANGSTASAAAARARASAAAAASASAAARASASAAAEASAASAARTRAAAAARRVVSLPVASVAAFGAGGAGTGDDPGEAADAIAGNPARPWATQWYTTAEFGLLKHGTGLLLDMGRRVAVTTVRLDLSPYQGAVLQLRVGDSAALPDLAVAATASNVGGALTLSPHHPVAARYLLIWITQLPPDGAGHYQETVSHVAVAGYR